MTVQRHVRTLARIGTVPAAALAALALAGTSLAAVSWTLREPPIPSLADAQLVAVSCPSASACMAIGNDEGLTASFSDTWNGTSWTMETVAGPQGTELTGVSCTSASSCEAVGSAADLPLAYHWDGTTWQAQTVPLPPGVTGGGLTGVSCVSSSSCVAVAQGFGTAVNFAETWNGTAWTPSRLPGAGITDLYGVACTAANSCFAVGDNRNGLSLADFWNGTRWIAQTMPGTNGGYYSGLNGVSCESATSCIAVGSYVSSAAHLLVYAWNGTAWAQQPVAITGLQHHSSELEGVSCGSTACTAVGEEAVNNNNVALAEHWNGTKWTRMTGLVIPPTGQSRMSGVSCHTQTTCVAVGEIYAEHES